MFLFLYSCLTRVGWGAGTQEELLRGHSQRVENGWASVLEDRGLHIKGKGAAFGSLPQVPGDLGPDLKSSSGNFHTSKCPPSTGQVIYHLCH